MIKSNSTLHKSERVGVKSLRGHKETPLQSLGASVATRSRLVRPQRLSSSNSSSFPPSRTLLRRSPRISSLQTKIDRFFTVGNSLFDVPQCFEPDGSSENQWEDEVDDVVSPTSSFVPNPLGSSPLSSQFGPIRHWNTEASSEDFPCVAHHHVLPPIVTQSDLSLSDSPQFSRTSDYDTSLHVANSVESMDSAVDSVSQALNAASTRLHQSHSVSSKQFHVVGRTSLACVSCCEDYDLMDDPSNIIIVCVHGVVDLGRVSAHVICGLGVNIVHLVPEERDALLQAAYDPSLSLDAFVFPSPSGCAWIFHLNEPRCIDASTSTTECGGVIFVNPQFAELDDSWAGCLHALTIGGLPGSYMYDTLLKLIRKQGGRLSVIYLTSRREGFLYLKGEPTTLTLPCFTAYCRSVRSCDALAKKFHALGRDYKGQWYTASQEPVAKFTSLISHIHSARVASAPAHGDSFAAGFLRFRRDNPDERLLLFLRRNQFFVAIVCGRQAGAGRQRASEWWGRPSHITVDEVLVIEENFRLLNMLRAIKHSVSAVSPPSANSASLAKGKHVTPPSPLSVPPPRKATFCLGVQPQMAPAGAGVTPILPVAPTFPPSPLSVPPSRKVTFCLGVQPQMAPAGAGITPILPVAPTFPEGVMADSGVSPVALREGRQALAAVAAATASVVVAAAAAVSVAMAVHAAAMAAAAAAAAAVAAADALAVAPLSGTLVGWRPEFLPPPSVPAGWPSALPAAAGLPVVWPVWHSSGLQGAEGKKPN